MSSGVTLVRSYRARTSSGGLTGIAATLRLFAGCSDAWRDDGLELHPALPPHIAVGEELAGGGRVRPLLTVSLGALLQSRTYRTDDSLGQNKMWSQ